MDVILEAFIFGFKAAAIGLTGCSILAGLIVGIGLIAEFIQKFIGSDFIANLVIIFLGSVLFMTLLYLMAYSHNGGKL